MHTGLEIMSSPSAYLPKAKTKLPPVDVELADVPGSGQYQKQVPPIQTTRSEELVTPAEAHANASTGLQTPKTPDELEASHDSVNPGQSNVAGLVPSFSHPPMNKYRVLCACMTYFVNGINDSGPYLQHKLVLAKLMSTQPLVLSFHTLRAITRSDMPWCRSSSSPWLSDSS